MRCEHGFETPMTYCVACMRERVGKAITLEVELKHAKKRLKALEDILDEALDDNSFYQGGVPLNNWIERARKVVNGENPDA